MSITRRFITLAMVTMLALSGGFAMAQDDASPQAEGSPSAFASGVGVPATTFDDRGNPTALITVTDILIDWTEYEVGMEPESGRMYVVVTYEFMNPTSRPMTAGIWQTVMYDDFGLRAEHGYYWGTSDFVTDDVAVEPGETVEAKVLYVIWADATPLLIMWQPSYESTAFIYVGE